jgi:uncharacterized protein
LVSYLERSGAANFARRALAYEWHADSDHWFRSYGSENWEFDERGLMCLRIASVNDAPIEESERK